MPFLEVIKLYQLQHFFSDTQLIVLKTCWSFNSSNDSFAWASSCTDWVTMSAYSRLCLEFIWKRIVLMAFICTLESGYLRLILVNLDELLFHSQFQKYMGKSGVTLSQWPVLVIWDYTTEKSRPKTLCKTVNSITEMQIWIFVFSVFFTFFIS